MVRASASASLGSRLWFRVVGFVSGAKGRVGLERVEVAVDGSGYGDDGGGHAARREALGEGGRVGGGDGPLG